MEQYSDIFKAVKAIRGSTAEQQQDFVSYAQILTSMKRSPENVRRHLELALADAKAGNWKTVQF